MAWTPVTLREARDDDAAVLARLWEELAIRGRSTEESLLGIKAAIARAASAPLERIVVAEQAGEVTGACHQVCAPISPLSEEYALRMSHLVVAESADDGVPKALVDGALSWAEDLGLGHVVTSTSSTNRDTNRLLARLGLTQASVIRVSTTTALRSRLPKEGQPVHGRRSSRQDRLLAARRSLRRQRDAG